MRYEKPRAELLNVSGLLATETSLVSSELRDIVTTPTVPHGLLGGYQARPSLRTRSLGAQHQAQRKRSWC